MAGTITSDYILPVSRSILQRLRLEPGSVVTVVFMGPQKLGEFHSPDIQTGLLNPKAFGDQVKMWSEASGLPLRGIPTPVSILYFMTM